MVCCSRTSWSLLYSVEQTLGPLGQKIRREKAHSFSRDGWQKPNQEGALVIDDPYCGLLVINADAIPSFWHRVDMDRVNLDVPY